MSEYGHVKRQEIDARKAARAGARWRALARRRASRGSSCHVEVEEMKPPNIYIKLNIR